MKHLSALESRRHQNAYLKFEFFLYTFCVNNSRKKTFFNKTYLSSECNEEHFIRMGTKEITEWICRCDLRFFIKCDSNYYPCPLIYHAKMDDSFRKHSEQSQVPLLNWNSSQFNKIFRCQPSQSPSRIPKRALKLKLNFSSHLLIIPINIFLLLIKFRIENLFTHKCSCTLSLFAQYLFFYRSVSFLSISIVYIQFQSNLFAFTLKNNNKQANVSVRRLSSQSKVISHLIST